MLDVVEVRSAFSGLLSLPLEDPTGGYFVEKIEGLDPVKATLVSSDYAQADGAQFRSARRDPRNIKFQISLEPDYSLESVQVLRERLYSFFMPKSLVNLRFKTSQEFGGLQSSRDIEGRVEDCTIDLFAEKTVANISVMCYQPDFMDPNITSVEGTTEFGTTNKTIVYPGSVETGFRLIIMNNPRAYAFTAFHSAPGISEKRLDITYPFQLNDVITISTAVGAKSVMLTRGGVTTSIFGALALKSSWLQLYPGPNTFRVYSDPGTVGYYLEYQAKYGGL